MIVFCPAGCGHIAETHAAVRVSFNQDLAPGERDYDAVACFAEECRCKVDLVKWNAMVVEDNAQQDLFEGP